MFTKPFNTRLLGPNYRKKNPKPKCFRFKSKGWNHSRIAFGLQTERTSIKIKNPTMLDFPRSSFPRREGTYVKTLKFTMWDFSFSLFSTGGTNKRQNKNSPYMGFFIFLVFHRRNENTSNKKNPTMWGFLYSSFSTEGTKIRRKWNEF